MIAYSSTTRVGNENNNNNNNNNHHRFKSLYLPHPQGAGALQNLHIRYLPILTYHPIPFLSSPPTFCLFRHTAHFTYCLSNLTFTKLLLSIINTYITCLH